MDRTLRMSLLYAAVKILILALNLQLFSLFVTCVTMKEEKNMLYCK